MSSGSKSAVYAGIAANVLVTGAKFVGFALTGSGAMLAESLHSLADVGNQVLLAVGMKRATLPADEEHPFGYGREAFVWSIISAVGIFFVGCGVSVTHGVQTLLTHHPHEQAHDAGGTQIALVILAVSFVIEGASFAVAMRGLAQEAKESHHSFWQHLRSTEDPFGVAVFLEDSAAMLGIVIAAAAIGMAAYTGDQWWDAAGSIAVGVLLGFVAMFLVRKNRSYLVGIRVKPEVASELRALIEADPAIERVVEQRASVQGTDEYRIRTEIDFDGVYMAEQWLKSQDVSALAAGITSDADLRAFLHTYTDSVLDLVGDEIDRIEGDIAAKMPKARHLELEPD